MASRAATPRVKSHYPPARPPPPLSASRNQAIASFRTHTAYRWVSQYLQTNKSPSGSDPAAPAQKAQAHPAAHHIPAASSRRKRRKAPSARRL